MVNIQLHLKDQAVVFRINPNVNKDEEPLFVPYWAMTFDELIPITLDYLMTQVVADY